VDYDAFSARIRSWASHAKVSTYGTVLEAGHRYPLFRLVTPGRPRVVITAGFHGEEPAGPLTLAKHFGALAAHAKKRGIGLTVFPCINPSGFVAGTRYNASGEHPNNDLLRYRVGRRWKGELSDGDTPSGWRAFKQSPKETRALLKQLEKLPTPVAALDLHQDNYMRRVATYAYVFGDAEHYRPLVRKASRHLEIAHDSIVDPRLRSDGHGLIWFHDGSVTDYFFRRGTAFCAALETTTQAPMEKCHAVNLIWLRGFVDLALSESSRSRAPSRRSSRR
jgi:hypothetical protein